MRTQIKIEREATIKMERGQLRLSFAYDPTVVESVAGIAHEFGAKKAWDRERREWVLPQKAALAVHRIFNHVNAPEQFGELVLHMLEYEAAMADRQGEIAGKVAQCLNLIQEPTRGGRMLYDFQRSGAEWLCRELKGVLADDMGLGKTIQSLVAARVLREAIGTSTVVICPANKQQDWKDESRDVGLVPFIHSWAKPPEGVAEPFTLIVDEAHYAQNMSSKRTRAMLDIADRADAVFLLTGTPMRHDKPVHLFPLLKAIGHPLASNRSLYELRYCAAKRTRFSPWDTSGQANLGELRERTKGKLLRRLKSECLSLPAKTRKIVKAVVSDENERAYTTAFESMRAAYREKQEDRRDGLNAELQSLPEMTGDEEADKLIQASAFQITKQLACLNMGDSITALTAIRLAASVGKIDTAIEEAEEAMSGGPVVVFTEFRASATAIAKHFGVEPFISGADYQTIERRFREGKTRHFVATIKAGGTGLNLQNANTVILVDRALTPGDNEQAEDRLHRIGQKWPVTSIWIQAFKSDEVIDEMLGYKKGVIDQVVEGAAAKAATPVLLKPHQLLGAILRA